MKNPRMLATVLGFSGMIASMMIFELLEKLF